ncbi:MAG: VWA domain-containing protein [Calditrichaeota bacterium]|nr:MAG: VWA domain-containing protein [Calditrichota bacterium]
MDITTTSHNLTTHLVTFARVLRRLGMQNGTEQVMDALRALECVGVRRRQDVYRAFAAIFVTRREQMELFDQAFDLFWRAPSKLPDLVAAMLPKLDLPANEKSKQMKRVRQAMAESQPQPRTVRKNPEKEVLDLVLTYSPTEVLRRKDFDAFSEEEMVMAKKLLAEMRWPISPRRTRRKIPRKNGSLHDLRRTIRQGMRHQGEMLTLSRRDRSLRPRDVTILCDISGSMERYARMLLHFMHTLTSGLRRVETFVFGTRLTRITRMLRQRDIDVALTEISRAVNDWAGGTRIGEALKDFNYLWARRVLRSGSVVVIISDGWDRGDAPLLAREMARLSRSCTRLIWLNPHLGYDKYEPLTVGMRTALPFIDDFLPVHNLESLEQLGELLSTMDSRRH